MGFAKWNSYGVRYRDKREVEKIRFDITKYLRTKNTKYIQQYIDDWEEIKKVKCFKEDSFEELVNVTNQKIIESNRSTLLLSAIAMDIWDVYHPLTEEEQRERSRVARKKIIEMGILP